MAVRDSTKIPRDRVVEIDHELYLLRFSVETESVSEHNSDIPLGPDDNNNNLSQKNQTEDEFDTSEDDLLGKDMDTGNSNTDIKDKPPAAGPTGAMSTQKCSTPAPGSNGKFCVL